MKSIDEILENGTVDDLRELIANINAHQRSDSPGLVKVKRLALSRISQLVNGGDR